MMVRLCVAVGRAGQRWLGLCLHVGELLSTVRLILLNCHQAVGYYN